jgi:hypothetical protein
VLDHLNKSESRKAFIDEHISAHLNYFQLILKKKNKQLHTFSRRFFKMPAKGELKWQKTQ